MTDTLRAPLPPATMTTPPAAALPAPLSPAALRLGYLALLPFVCGALLVWLVRAEAHPYVGAALAGYAAVVVAFLGGVHWGFGFARREPDARRFVWGVVPALVAWVAVLMPPYAGLVVLGVALVGCYLVDRRVYPVEGAGAWLTLRFRLSAVASLACFVGAAGS